MRRRLPLLALWLVACGGRPPPTPPPPPAPAEGEADEVAIAGIPLPRMPVEVSPEDPELAPGWAATETALTMPTPAPPGGEAWEVEAWADGELAGWMRRKAEAVAAAQRALEPARAAEPAYTAVASLLLGLAYSRFALDLRGIPVPRAFRDDPVRAEAFRNALVSAAGPLWQRALDAFGSCASVAAGAPAHSLAHWRERCDAEGRAVAEMLPDAPPVPVAPDAEDAPGEDGRGARLRRPERRWLEVAGTGDRRRSVAISRARRKTRLAAGARRDRGPSARPMQRPRS